MTLNRLRTVAIFLAIPNVLWGVAVANKQTTGSLVSHGVEQALNETDNQPTTIRPGVSVGPLQLGATRERTLELFQRKPIDQETPEPFDCGTVYNWVDSENPRVGNVFIRFKEGFVFQIESATTRYHPEDGLTTYSSPEEVRRHHKGLHAYVLLRETPSALGERPFVYWIDKKEGIGFCFAYNKEQRARYLYKIMIFKPNASFCADGETTSSPRWREIAPYSLEPPNATASLIVSPRDAL